MLLKLCRNRASGNSKNKGQDTMEAYARTGWINGMNFQEVNEFFDSISIVDSEIQFKLADRMFRGNPASNLIILENLNAVVIRAEELGLYEKHAEQIIRIRNLCLHIEKMNLSSTILELPSQFESDFNRANAGEFLPAYRRLALCICLGQNGKLFSDIDASKLNDASVDPQDGESSNSDDVESYNSNTMKPTKAEIAVLYDEFIAFQDKILETKNKNVWSRELYTLENMPIDWRVEYQPCEELGEIMIAGYAKIAKARERAGEPRLPLDRGVGFKCDYTIIDGCAFYNDRVIDHNGKLLNEHPWKTFYRTEDLVDEKRARELCPKIPLNLKLKIENRKISRCMGYTFASSAIDQYYAKNWGVLKSLIAGEKGNIPQKEGFELLDIAFRDNKWDICCALYTAGLPIMHARESSFHISVSDFDHFFNIVKKCDPWYLLKILKVAKLPIANYNSQKMLTYLSQTFFERYQERDVKVYYSKSIENEIFDRLAQLWCSVAFPEKTKASWKDKNQFVKSIISLCDHSSVPLKDKEFELYLRGRVKKI